MGLRTLTGGRVGSLDEDGEEWGKDLNAEERSRGLSG